MLQVKYIITLATAAFFLHLAWENAQAPLYAGYQSFAQHFPMCLKATISDVAITLSVLAFLRLMRKESIKTIADFAPLATIGFVVAVAIEQRALIAGAWHYASAMPLVPWLHIGLAPVLQMTVLLPLSFYATNALLLNKKMA